MFNFEQACAVADQLDLERANMVVEPRPEGETEPFHFSAEFRDVALRHAWTMARAAEAAQIRERGIPRFI